jgi:succinate-semialdehyde dehydrogenase/glutarate-semialdehyde dehydrogenase
MLELENGALLRSESYVNGKWVAADSGKTFPVTNPADGSLIAEVANLDAADVTRAVECSYEAFQTWRETTAKQRSIILRRWFNLIMQNQEDLARLMTAEQGKPLAESRGEVAYGASFIEWFAEEGKRIYGDVIPTHMNDRRILVLKQPIGVAAAITPWNFPNAMITRKAAPALAAGCTFLVKPASETPLSALALAVLAEEAGLPAGVFNVVTTRSSADVGRVLTEHPLIMKFSFTGSTGIGKLLMQQCTSTVKKVSMELGGNAPFIVFDDADIDAAVSGAIASKYRNAGQTCVCANRMLVQDGIHDAFVEKFTEAVKKMNVGRGDDESVQVGPMIAEDAIAWCWAATATNWAACFLSPPWSVTSHRTWSLRSRKFSVRWRRYSVSVMNRKRFKWPMTPSMVLLPISMRATWVVSGVWRKPWNTAWSASMTEYCPPNPRHSVALRNPVSDVRVQNMESRITLK